MILAIAHCVLGRSFSLGTAHSALPLTSSGTSLTLENVNLLLGDVWVDTQITTPLPSLCKSISDCGWNGEDMFSRGSRGKLSSDGAMTAPSLGIIAESVGIGESAVANLQTEQASRRFALEVNAVHLSLLVQQGCMESGNRRRCWRSSTPGSFKTSSDTPRVLNPVTIEFSESRDPRSSSKTESPVLLQHQFAAPLISSLKPFRLHA